MKAVVFSTEDKNGAGGAAYRIYRAIDNCGVESQFFISAIPKYNNSIQVLPSNDSSFFERLNWNLNKKNAENGNSLVSIYYPIVTNEELLTLCQDADIINIHWIVGLLSTENIRWICGLGKPIVITLHDERMYTGGCHYRNGCKGHLNGCNDCKLFSNSFLAKYIFAEQAKLFNSNVTFVSPSSWLASKAKDSLIMRDYDVRIIPNGHDTDIFKPLDREKLRAINGITDSFVILCGAQNLNEKRKGFDLLVKTLDSIKLKLDKSGIKIKLISFGMLDCSEIEGIDVLSFGYVDEEEKLAEIYNIADVLALPSREDNLPNIMIESLCCGTPVVSFAVGGMVDVIQDNKNGYLVEPFNVELFAEAIIKISQKGNSMRKFCRNDAVSKYSLSACGEAYKSLFKELTIDKFLKSYDIGEVLPFFTTYIEEYKDSKVSIAEDLMAKMMIAHFERNSNIVADICRRVIKQYKLGKKIIIFGYGSHGREVEKYMKGLIDFFIDNNSNSKKGKVRNPNVLKDVSKGEYTVIISVEKCDEICRQLEDMGYIENINYFTYQNEVEI